MTQSRTDGTPLEIRSLTAGDETIGFSAEPGLVEPTAEAPEEEPPGSGSPDESSSAESGADPGPGTGLPPVSQVSSGPEEPVGRDLQERLWQLAKETAWRERPFKAELRILAAVLPPGERLIGTGRLSFRRADAFVFTVTDRALYLSHDKEDRYWKNLRDSTPERFHFDDLVLSFPLTEVETCTIIDGFFVLQIRNEPKITFKVSWAPSAKALVDKFFDTAREGMPN